MAADSFDSSFDPERPLDRIPKESARANAALRDYALMGPGRSLRKLLDRYCKQKFESRGASQPATTRWASISTWSIRNSWQARVETFEKLVNEEAERLWHERRKKLREDEWQFGSDLLDLARSMLAEGPKFVKTTRRVNSKTGQEIITIALDGHFLNQSAETAVKLRRMAAGEPTEVHEISGPNGGPIEVTDGFTDEQRAERVAALLDAARERRTRQSLES